MAPRPRRSAILELATLVGTLAGVAALSTLGGALLPASGIAAVLLALSRPVRPFLPPIPWVLPTLVAAGLGLTLPLLLGATLPVSLAFAVLSLQVVRRLARSGPRDDRASLLLALLMLVLAGSTSASPILLPAVVAWAVSLPVVGVLGHLEAVGGRVARTQPVVGRHLAWMSLTVLVLGGLVFAAMPRARHADLAGVADPGDARIGFADDIELGDLGALLDDPTVALRLTLPEGAPAPTYVRGLVLDTFDGRGWKSTLPDATPARSRPEDAIPVHIQHEPLAGPVAFAPGHIVALDLAPPGAVPDAAGSWRLTGPPGRHAYTAWIVPVERLPSEPWPRWTRLPGDLDPRIRELAAEVSRGTDDPRVAADRVAAWLDAGFRYTHAPRDRKAEAPLARFLFDTRSGHCEYFATAAAVLLRAEGHSARVVNGYARPVWNPAGYWQVARGNAHAWVEVRDADGHWFTLDPTPGGSRPPLPPSPWAQGTDAVQAWWVDGILAYDGSMQLAAVQGAGWWVQSRVTGATPQQGAPWLGLALILGPLVAIGLGVVLGVRRLGRRLAGERPPLPRGRVARLHARARAHVVRAGWDVPAALPPVEAAAWLAVRAPEAGSALEELAWLHYRVRYGGEDDATLLAEARPLLQRIRSTLPRRNAALPAVPEASP